LSSLATAVQLNLHTRKQEEASVASKEEEEVILLHFRIRSFMHLGVVGFLAFGFWTCFRIGGVLDIDPSLFLLKED
jgi:hypothetical protein